MCDNVLYIGKQRGATMLSATHDIQIKVCAVSLYSHDSSDSVHYTDPCHDHDPIRRFEHRDEVPGVFQSNGHMTQRVGERSQIDIL